MFLGKDTESGRNISYVESRTEELQGLLEVGIMNTERAGKMSCKLIYEAFVWSEKELNALNCVSWITRSQEMQKRLHIVRELVLTTNCL
jgi:hypothetical protein